jgi:hypothetical protein
LGIDHGFLEAWVDLQPLWEEHLVRVERKIAADAHIPGPVPSSAASIKLDIEGKENLDELGSSIGGDGGLCTRREYEYSVADGLEYLRDMLGKIERLR